MTQTVSVLIPAYNEEKNIGRCIASVLRNDWPRELMQILVMDNRSTDSTAERARLAGAEVLPAPARGIGAVRNVGLAAAKGNYVAYVDADCEVPHTWLRTAIGLLQSNQNIGAVGGPCLSSSEGTWVQRCLAPTRTVAGIVTPANAIATSSFIAPTALLRESGGFDESLTSGEDDDMSNRIQSRGLQVVSASDCHIVHNGYPRTWLGVLKKEIWHGRHHIEVRTKLDVTLLLTFLFILVSAVLPLAILAAMLAAGTRSLSVLGLALVLQLAPPLLFALKRVRQSAADLRLIFPSTAVGYAYFIGHSLGVLANLRQRMTAPKSADGTSLRAG